MGASYSPAGTTQVMAAAITMPIRIIQAVVIGIVLVPLVLAGPQVVAGLIPNEVSFLERVYWPAVLVLSVGFATPQVRTKLLDESRAPRLRWEFFEAWVSKYEGPALNATTNEAARNAGSTLTGCTEFHRWAEIFRAAGRFPRIASRRDRGRPRSAWRTPATTRSRSCSAWTTSRPTAVSSA